jgi:hypothetical protein
LLAIFRFDNHQSEKAQQIQYSTLYNFALCRPKTCAINLNRGLKVIFRRSKAMSRGEDARALSNERDVVVPFPRHEARALDGVIDLSTFERALNEFSLGRQSEPLTPHHSQITFKPDGLRIEDAVIDFPIALASKRFNFSLNFVRCRFTQQFDVRWATLDALTLKDCTLEKMFLGTALETRGNVDFTGTTSLAQIDLSQARIQSDLVLSDGKLSYSGPKGSNTEDPRNGAALFCPGLQVHSLLMDRLHCRGRIFLDASRLSGILKAGDAVFERDGNIKPTDFGKWDHIVFSASDTDIHGAVILGEEAWGKPRVPQIFRADGQVNLSNSRIGGDLICTNAKFHSAYYKASDEDYAAFVRPDAPQDNVLLVSLNVTRTVIEGGVWLNGDFRSCGQVRFDSSNVKGTFCCSEGTFIGALPLCEVEPEDRRKRYKVNFAFNLYRVEIGGTLMLNNGFIAFGRVSLRNAVLHGDLDCQGGTFHGCWRDRAEDPLDEEHERQPEALALSGAEIAGSVFLTRESRHRPDGDIVDNPVSSGDDRLKRRTFRSYGQVRLRGTRIARNLHLGGGCFDVMPAPDDWGKMSSSHEAPKPLVGWFHSAKVEGTIFHIEVDRYPVCFRGSVSFANVRTGGWQDSVECWPHCSGDANTQGAVLELNGLTYDSLRGPMNGEERLIWLLHQPWKDLSQATGRKSRKRLISRMSDDGHESVGFKAQPWEQCATILQGHGYRTDASFLYRIEQRFIRYTIPTTQLNRLWNFILGTFVGHGYRVLFAILWAVWLVGLGTIIAASGYRDGYIVPTPESSAAREAAVLQEAVLKRSLKVDIRRHILPDSSRDANASRVLSKRDSDFGFEGVVKPVPVPPDSNRKEDGTSKLSESYPAFHPFLFSLDMALPAGNVRQIAYWIAVDDRNLANIPSENLNSPPFVTNANRRSQRFIANINAFFGSHVPNVRVEEFIGFALAAIIAWFLKSRFLRGVPVPRFKSNPVLRRSDARKFYLDTVNRGRSFLGRNMPPIFVGAVAYLFFLAWAIYLIDRQITFAFIDSLDDLARAWLRMSFAHLWFVGETLMGWILITAVAVSLGTTIFQYRRERS